MLVADPLREPAIAIADDLTGATEVALVLAETGLGDVAWLWREEGTPPPERAFAVNLDTRDLPADQARERLAAFLAGRPDLRHRIVFKKVDSTARRHLAAEIDVCLAYPEFDAVVVALAAPDDRRRTQGAIHHVGDVPVDRTPFARDLVAPTAHLPTLLTAGTGRACRHVPMKTVRGGPRAVADAIEAACGPTRALIAMDCETRDDLRAIAGGILAASRRILPVGSAAFFRQLIAAAAESAVPMQPPPVLVVCGSLHPVSRRQVDRLCAVSGSLVEMGEGDPQAVTGALSGLIAAGQVAVLTTPRAPVPEGADGSAGTRIAQSVGEVVRMVIERSRPGGIVAMGGAIAAAVIRALDAEGLRIRDKLSPVVPVLELVGGPFAGLPLITKGGGVGGDDILIDAVARLRWFPGSPLSALQPATKENAA